MRSNRNDWSVVRLLFCALMNEWINCNVTRLGQISQHQLAFIEYLCVCIVELIKTTIKQERLFGLQPIYFSDVSLDSLIDCLVCNMSKNSEKCLSQIVKVKGSVCICLMSKRDQKIFRLIWYKAEKSRKSLYLTGWKDHLQPFFFNENFFSDYFSVDSLIDLTVNRRSCKDFNLNLI